MKKLNKVLSILIALLLVVGVASCNKHKHEFSNEWTSDATNHWHVCTGEECEEKDGIAAHTFGDWQVVTAATENANGSKERSCSVCGYKETDTITKLNHTHTWSNTYSSDATNHWKTCTASGCNEKNSEEAHTFSEWTYSSVDQKEHRTCNVCSYSEERTHTHSLSQTYSNDATNHWKVCSVCSSNVGTAAHTFESKNDDNHHWEECTVCGYQKNSEVHNYTVKVIDKTAGIPTEATLTSAGSTGIGTYHMECSCGKKEDGSDVEIPAVILGTLDNPVTSEYLYEIAQARRTDNGKTPTVSFSSGVFYVKGYASYIKANEGGTYKIYLYQGETDNDGILLETATFGIEGVTTADFESIFTNDYNFSYNEKIELVVYGQLECNSKGGYQVKLISNGNDVVAKVFDINTTLKSVTFINKPEVIFFDSEDIELTCSINKFAPANSTYTIESSDTNVVTIVDNKIHYVGAGTATISVKYGNNVVGDTFTITAYADQVYPTSITTTQTESIDKYTGESVDLKTLINFGQYVTVKNLVVTVNDSQYANSTVEFTTAGTYTVKAKAETENEGTYTNELTFTFNVTNKQVTLKQLQESVINNVVEFNVTITYVNDTTMYGVYMDSNTQYVIKMIKSGITNALVGKQLTVIGTASYNESVLDCVNVTSYSETTFTNEIVPLNGNTETSFVAGKVYQFTSLTSEGKTGLYVRFVLNSKSYGIYFGNLDSNSDEYKIYNGCSSGKKYLNDIIVTYYGEGAVNSVDSHLFSNDGASFQKTVCYITAVTVSGSKSTIAPNATTTLSFTKTPTVGNYFDNNSARWYSDNEDIATVDNNGLVTGKATGTVKIYYEIKVNNTVVTAYKNITVAEYSITKVEGENKTISANKMATGSTINLSPVWSNAGTPESIFSTTYTIKSGSAELVTISNNTITAGSTAGSTIIVCSVLLEEGGTPIEKDYAIEVVANEANSSNYELSFVSGSTSMKVDGTIEVVAVKKVYGLSDVTLVSSDTNKLSKNGNVYTALAVTAAEDHVYIYIDGTSGDTIVKTDDITITAKDEGGNSEETTPFTFDGTWGSDSDASTASNYTVTKSYITINKSSGNATDWRTNTIENNSYIQELKTSGTDPVIAYNSSKLTSAIINLSLAAMNGTSNTNVTIDDTHNNSSIYVTFLDANGDEISEQSSIVKYYLNSTTLTKSSTDCTITISNLYIPESGIWGIRLNLSGLTDNKLSTLDKIKVFAFSMVCTTQNII